MKSLVRVLVVDDSALMRKLIPQLLQGDRSIEVVGTAMDGLLGLKKIKELKPDVVTLDLEMPRMDGLDMLREIVRQYSIPVIVVSSHTSKGAYSALNALTQGAFDFIAKPTDASKGGLEQIARELGSAQTNLPPGADGHVNDETARYQEPALARYRHRCLDRRTECSALHLLAAPGGFHGLLAYCSTYARRFHRDVRAAVERLLPDSCDRGSVG
jgi:chemotaxis response regulator CheB